MRLRTLSIFLIPLFLLSLGLIPAAGKAQWGWSDPARLSAEDLQAKDESYQGLLPKAQQEGSVRVIVTLNIPFKPEGIFQIHAAVQAQRNGIATAQEAIAKRIESSNSRVLHNFKYVPIMALQVDAEGLSDLNANPQVKYIQEDVPEPPTLSESIPLIGADQAWLSGYTGSGQVVAILDTGVDGAHEFLSGKVVAEACFSTTYGSPYNSTTVCPDASEQQIGPGAGVNCPLENNGCDHGTHVAGIAAGSGVSFSGVAPDAQIIAIQVFSRFNSDTYCGLGNSPCVLTYNTDQMRALEWVYEQRASFNIASANMSLGGGGETENCDTDSRKSYIDTLRSVGIATVIASGNDYYRDAISKPACISSAISVGSTNDYSPVVDDVSSFSNIASFISLLAPGWSINSSVPGGSYGAWGGTSMAAPHVAGAWAVLKSKALAASVDQVLAALRDTGVLVDDTRSGGTVTNMPRIQVDAAVAALDDSTPTPTATSTSTSTPTDTPTPTFTSTSTSTSTSTATSTDTSTPTSTSTSTSTLTPTDTSTPTSTSTSTSTSTPTSTSTVTDTPTYTPTATPTDIFGDVPSGHWAYDNINALYEAGYVAGCSAEPRLYCPERILTRAESSVFVMRGEYGTIPDPPYSPPDTPTFVDVSKSYWGYGWIESLWKDEFTAGCWTDPLMYCPLSQHTRAEGSVFFLRVKNGVGYEPPPADLIFDDVDLEDWYVDWVEAAYEEGILPACQDDPLRFCPEDELDRAWAAYMMVQAKGGLPLP